MADGIRLVWIPEEVEEVGTVTFRPAEPTDEHEARLLVRLSAAAWISQGCPRELTVTLTGPIPEVPHV